MSFALNTIMDAIAAEIVADLPAGTRASAYPIPNPTPPQVIVGYPTRLDYDMTFHAGATTGKIEATFPVWYVVGQVLDKAARDALSAVITGAPGIKESLDGNLAGAVDYCTVKDCQVAQITIADVRYLAARFDVEVVA